jgi:CubicO group peptidase (beta-lactamase class C family)
MTSTVVHQNGSTTAQQISDAEVQGTCPDRFSAVHEAFAAHLASGADVGASVAVYIDGESVVDLWGGYFDMSYTRPWERDTIVHTFSSTKTMTAMCALVLADRGEIDLDAPVARYWPEFAANGKGDIRVRHVVSHTSGLAGWSEPVTMRDLCDREKSTDLLARQAPWWEPGTASGYHCYTIGHLVARWYDVSLDRHSASSSLAKWQAKLAQTSTSVRVRSMTGACPT